MYAFKGLMILQGEILLMDSISLFIVTCFYTFSAVSLKVLSKTSTKNLHFRICDILFSKF